MEMICNACRKRTDIEKPKLRTEGELQIQYITCPDCGQEYIVAVTDPDLRKDIKRYIRLQRMIKKGNATVATYRDAEKVKAANASRCRDLITEYLGLE